HLLVALDRLFGLLVDVLAMDPIARLAVQDMEGHALRGGRTGIESGRKGQLGNLDVTLPCRARRQGRISRESMGFNAGGRQAFRWGRACSKALESRARGDSSGRSGQGNGCRRDLYDAVARAPHLNDRRRGGFPPGRLPARRVLSLLGAALQW